MTTRLGRYSVHQVSDGSFRLDGGAMYGVVPKVLWSRSCAPDERNRIPLALGCLLIRTPSGKNVLVDTGLSSKYDKNHKFLSMYAVERPKTLRGALKDLGVAPEDVHIVINTHLHFDHAGGDTEFDASGRPLPTFPRARYIVQKEEWEDANSPHERNHASYMEENYAPLQDRKVLDLVEGEFEIEPGLKVIRSGGHTRGHQCVLIESEGKAGLFLGDLIPTRSHVPLPWIMGYDLFPVDTMEAKRGFLKSAREGDWLLLFQHDPGQRSGYLREADGREVVVPPEALAS